MVGKSDLWEYSPTDNLWRKLFSSSQITPIYENDVITPGARVNASIWVDDNGVWLHGGLVMDLDNPYPLDDVWQFNFFLDTWIWFRGRTGNFPVYPLAAGMMMIMIKNCKLLNIQADACIECTPGMRSPAIATWRSGNLLYLYGGAIGGTEPASMIHFHHYFSIINKFIRNCTSVCRLMVL